MTDLEKTIDGAENTEATTTSGVGDDFSLDFSDSLPQENLQNEPNLSESSSSPMDISTDLTIESPSTNLVEESPSNPTEDSFSQDLSEGNSSPVLNEDTSSPSIIDETSSPNLSKEIIQTNVSSENPNKIPTGNSLVENLSNFQPDLTETQQATNNEISLGKFEDEPITMNNEQTSDISAISTETSTPLEQPTINENPLAENPVNNNLQDHETNKLTAKEKLAQLVKTHESKAQKSGFIKGIFSGVALTIVIVLAGFMFAKDQIFDLINKIDGDNQPLTANITDIINTSDEEIISEDENTNDDIEIDDEETIIENEDSYFEDESIDEEFTDEDFYDDEIIIDEEDNYLDEEIMPEDEDIQITSDDEQSYTITHVESEENANWVLPSHCSDLTCYGEDKEFTPCTTFRLAANLDENANRIGKNGACKYKDASELVYVEFHE